MLCLLHRRVIIVSLLCPHAIVLACAGVIALAHAVALAHLGHLGDGGGEMGGGSDGLLPCSCKDPPSCGVRSGVIT
jgi:hypothetical protein